MTALLKFGYDFNSDQKFEAVKKINGVSADWTLGAAIFSLRAIKFNKTLVFLCRNYGSFRPLYLVLTDSTSCLKSL